MKESMSEQASLIMVFRNSKWSSKIVRDRNMRSNRNGIANPHNADLANGIDCIGQATVQQL